jgi:hypothetical protein
VGSPDSKQYRAIASTLSDQHGLITCTINYRTWNQVTQTTIHHEFHMVIPALNDFIGIGWILHELVLVVQRGRYERISQLGNQSHHNRMVRNPKPYGFPTRSKQRRDFASSFQNERIGLCSVVYRCYGQMAWYTN